MKKIEKLTVGVLAKRCGVNLETVRYYERTGLLLKPRREASGYRVYSGETVRRLAFIKHAQHLGFSLKEIKELLQLRADPVTTCADVRQKADAKMGEIDLKIKSLLAIKDALKRLATTCMGQGPVSECPILESLDGPA